ncbi:MAG: GNAT family N-acetyltransferase [Sphingomonadaceae bacterium]|nr:GNAT family N-acetyltransferase [Sphingomonadaceae bacterium]
MISHRLLRADETDRAADLHRRAGALIPGYDTSRHTPAEFAALYRDRVIRAGPIWGAYDGPAMVGFVALLPGWIDHLYVEPARHGEGIGSGLLRLAQREQDDLQLHTFQANVRARALYEQHGFVLAELTDGSRNEEQMPDVRYYWRRG